MSFVQTLLLFTGVATLILVPIFVGHALSTHHNQYYIYALVAGVIGAIIVGAHVKTARTPTDHVHH